MTKPEAKRKAACMVADLIDLHLMSGSLCDELAALPAADASKVRDALLLIINRFDAQGEQA